MALTASQRIKLIKEIARRVGGESWALIDVTLRQFSLPTSDTWNGTGDSYVMHMVDQASDAVLVDLANHAGFHFEPESVPLADPPFWVDGMLRVFLSHLSTQRSFAAQLQLELFRYGMTAFVAHNDIEPTAEWQSEIELALKTCDTLIALLHPGFHESKWTDQEIGFAMGRGVPSFAVKFGEDPYGFVGRFQAFNGRRKDVSVLASEIFTAYSRHRQTRRKMSEAIVSLFEVSESFAEAKARIAMVERVDFWKSSFDDRLKAAVESNQQISGAYGVSQTVNRIIRQRAAAR
ncbi:MAG TPA: toll/interleukin-1 receptor domain-containing protein [Bauldia sp.]|nr:toll/interleukin-1 receptor domain-containing protein [Bauldia sp.]